MMQRRSLVMLAAVAALVTTGCDDDPGPVDSGVADGGLDDGGPVDSGPIDGGGELTVPASYAFDSRFEPGTSSVDHGGQTGRQVLIADLSSYVSGLTAEIDGGEFEPTTDGQVVERLEYFFSVAGAERVDDPFRLTTDPATLQTTYGDISGSANLLDKLAGNDASTDHRDWSTEFVGWSDAAIAANGGDIDTPTNFVRALFETVEENAIARAGGVDRLSPAGEQLPVHVTESGVDLHQLLQKFLYGAVNFSQAADDYTDDDVEGKGLLTDNTMADGDSAHTALEHAWDEAFGYFGASAQYGDRTAEAVAAGPSFVDHDGDGRIDLLTEYDFGASVNCGKRDHASAASARTDFMGQAWLGFRTGRAIITHAGGALDADAMADLREQRELAIGAWEAAIAATVVHYINDVLAVMEDFDTAAYDHARFLTHAKAWSEMKGFALMFQFNPRSPVGASDFAQLHTLLGDAPVLPAAGATAAEAYRVALRDARGILGTAYGFDAANLGDDVGANGW